MSLAHPPVFALADADSGHLVLRSPEDHVAHVMVLEEDIIRVMILPHGRQLTRRSWTICPGGEDLPPEGRDRFDLSGFSQPKFELSEAKGRLSIATSKLKLEIALDGFRCSWWSKIAGQWQPAAADRPTQAYNFGWWDKRVYHYLARERDEAYFGLGERAGDANRAGHSFRMLNIDAMGYDARTTDPLYKHIPFYMLWKPSLRLPLGIFYDTLSDCRFDMGRELDNYHGLYRSFIAEDGDLDYWVIAGDSPIDITKRFTWLTGRPAFMPKWSLGYSGSTMSYTDAPDAQAQMNQFLEKCRQHDILCTSFHLSSGYTSIGPKRYVFNWNRDKFPDPKAFSAHYMAHGLHLCANIKPCLLRDHPDYEDAAKRGLFIKGSDGEPAAVQFWDETGAYLDFTNPDTLQWWKGKVTSALLENGLDSTWNDNNEFEIWDDRASIDGFGKGGRAAAQRPLHTLLMIQASRQAQKAFAPDLRPFLISRAGAAGMQRYVQSWSGDNRTGWDTLKYNIRMGTGLALSGVSNIGHDIGGFAGPAPDAELLLRWVQFGIFMPRFSIHSWNDDQTVNEPWMYPEITPHISALIKLRARLIPYFYDLAWKSHRNFEPMIRPTFLEFPDDPNSILENDEMLLGPSLLVAAVVEPGQTSRRVTLPKGAAWIDFWSGQRFAGGATITLPARLDARPPLLAREGSAIALNLAEQHFNQPSDRRGFAIFPQRNGRFTYECFEDDGVSETYRQGAFKLWRITVTAGAAIEIAIEGGLAGEIALLLPVSETRKVTVPGLLSDQPEDGWRSVKVRR